MCYVFDVPSLMYGMYLVDVFHVHTGMPHDMGHMGIDTGSLFTTGL